MARLVVTLWSLLALCDSAAGQTTTVRVIDGAGEPLAAVRIDVFGRGEVLATAVTSSSGAAEIDVPDWTRVRRLSLSRLGLQTTLVQVDDIPADGVLRMEPEAFDLPGLGVVGRRLCPVEDSEEARGVWRRTAEQYSQETELRALTARLTRTGEAVSETNLYRATDGDGFEVYVAWSGGVWHGADHRAKPLSERTATEGYAWEPIDIGGIRDPGAWAYAELHVSSAHHFASDAFGAAHHFATDRRSEDMTTIVFCPAEDAPGATIRGVLRVDADGWFESADWRFETVGRSEGAGGSVELAAHHESGSLPHLIAERGMLFRHSLTPPPFPELPRDYQRVSVAVHAWTVHPAWAHPCGEANGGVPGGGHFKVMPVRARTAEEVAFRACVERNWGVGPR